MSPSAASASSVSSSSTASRRVPACLAYGPDRDGQGLTFHPTPGPTQEDIEQLVERVSKRILRFLQRRGVITLVTAPGDGEVTGVPDETLGEQDPLLAKLLAAATTGAAPAGPASKRQPIRIVLDPDDRPVGKGALCAASHGFNLQTRLRRCHARRRQRQARSRKVVQVHPAPTLRCWPMTG